MPDFSDIALEYEKIKETPEVIDTLREKKNTINRGLTADSLNKRQDYLPDPQSHYRLQDKLSRMFDKSSRAGAKSTLGGLVMPNGRKMFAEFHDNYTGTGRIQPTKAPDKVLLPENGPQLDVKKPSVVLYERCVDCCERIDKDNCVPNMLFLPPGDLMSPAERSKWASVDIKPESVICYLFCVKCPTKVALEYKKIAHDPFKTKFIVWIGPDGKPVTAAEKESREFLTANSTRISNHVFEQIKHHRSLPDSDIFYGEAKL